MDGINQMSCDRNDKGFSMESTVALMQGKLEVALQSWINKLF